MATPPSTCAAFAEWCHLLLAQTSPSKVSGDRLHCQTRSDSASEEAVPSSCTR